MTIQQKENAQEVLEVQENKSTKDAFKFVRRGNRQMDNKYKSDKLVSRRERDIELEKTKIQIETIAKQILKDMGIKMHHLGFKYWITAIYITLDIDFNNRPELKMMELYYMVAKKHKTTASKAERAMRYAYATIDLKQYFNVTYSINNTALLFLLIEAVRERLYNPSNLDMQEPKILLCNKNTNTPK